MRQSLQKKLILGLLLLLAAAFFMFPEFAFHLRTTFLPWQEIQYVVRYKIDARYSVDGNIGVGDGVWETTFGFAPMGPTSFRPRVTLGEAFPIEMPDGQRIYLLRRAEGSHISYGLLNLQCIFQQGSGSREMSAVYRDISAWTGPCEEESGLPMLVKIDDPLRPQTIREVAYERAESQCINSCLQITVSRTTEPLSRGIETELPWLPEHFGYGLIKHCNQCDAVARANMPTVMKMDFTSFGETNDRP